MHVDLELPRTPESAAAARQALDELAPQLPRDRFADIRLMVSELVTNAIRHAGLDPDDRIQLALRITEQRVRIEVCDRGPGFEYAESVPDPARGSGWGLFLVHTLADRWGVERDELTRVWFELDHGASARG